MNEWIRTHFVSFTLFTCTSTSFTKGYLKLSYFSPAISPSKWATFFHGFSFELHYVSLICTTRLYNSNNNFQVNLHCLVKLTRILLHIFPNGPSLTIPAIYRADPKLIHTSRLWITIMLFISSYHCNLKPLLCQTLISTWWKGFLIFQRCLPISSVSESNAILF